MLPVSLNNIDADNSVADQGTAEDVYADSILSQRVLHCTMAFSKS